MKEHDIQNKIRNALCGKGLFFRANVGRAWTGSECLRLPNGDMLIKNPRPFTSGLPAGFSDLVGIVPHDTPAGIFGRFCAIEVKSKTGRISAQQQNFIDAIKKNGGMAGVARCVDDALEIIK